MTPQRTAKRSQGTDSNLLGPTSSSCPPPSIATTTTAVPGNDSDAKPLKTLPPQQLLPAWAIAALEKERQENLAQPWKTTFAGADYEDDPNFSRGRDTVLFYDKRVKVCFGEGSMAA